MLARLQQEQILNPTSLEWGNFFLDLFDFAIISNEQWQEHVTCLYTNLPNGEIEIFNLVGLNNNVFGLQVAQCSMQRGNSEAYDYFLCKRINTRIRIVAAVMS